MALISLKCPNCDGNIQMDDAKEKGFCMYCGSNFLVKDEIQRIHIEHSGIVELSKNRQVDNLLIRAKQKIEGYENKGLGFDDYYQEILYDFIEKALDMEPQYPKIMEFKKGIIKQRVDSLLAVASFEIENHRMQRHNIDYYYVEIIHDYIDKALAIDSTNQEAHAMKKKLLEVYNDNIENEVKKLRAQNDEAQRNAQRNAQRDAEETLKDLLETRNARKKSIISILIGTGIIIIVIILIQFLLTKL